MAEKRSKKSSLKPEAYIGQFVWVPLFNTTQFAELSEKVVKEIDDVAKAFVAAEGQTEGEDLGGHRLEGLRLAEVGAKRRGHPHKGSASASECQVPDQRRARRLD